MMRLLCLGPEPPSVVFPPGGGRSRLALVHAVCHRCMQSVTGVCSLGLVYAVCLYNDTFISLSHYPRFDSILFCKLNFQPRLYCAYYWPGNINVPFLHRVVCEFWSCVSTDWPQRGEQMKVLMTADNHLGKIREWQEMTSLQIRNSGTSLNGYEMRVKKLHYTQQGRNWKW